MWAHKRSGSIFNFSKVKEYNFLHGDLWKKQVTYTLFFLKYNEKLSNNQPTLSNNTKFLE